MNIQIRKALEVEIEWINEKYNEVQFSHSIFQNELIAIAEINGEKAGLGRLVTIDHENLELGGMYVFDSFRGHGIAARLVDFLLTQAKSHYHIYCIPFTKLTGFYRRFGFTPLLPTDKAPEHILNKYQWCEQSYDEKVELLFLPSRQGREEAYKPI